MAEVDFRMVITDVVRIPDRPFLLVRGERFDGNTRVGAVLDLRRPDGTTQLVTVRTVEFPCRPGQAPQSTEALTLGIGDGLTAEQVLPGQVLVAP